MIVTKLARMDGTLLAYSAETGVDCLAIPAQVGLQIIEFDTDTVSDQNIALTYTPKYIGTQAGWIPVDESYPMNPTVADTQIDPVPAPGVSTAENQ